MMFEFWQKERSWRRADTQRIVQEYKIIHVSPISLAESGIWHLLLVTQNGFRVYVTFTLQRTELPTGDDLRQDGINLDLLMVDRFTAEWSIAEIMYFPD